MAKGSPTKTGATKGSPTRSGGSSSTADVEEEKKEKSSTLKPKKIEKPKGASSPSKGPPGIICYICGRKYGTTSFEIHEKQCIDLWEKTEAQKPKKERRPVPQRPKVFEDVKVGGKGAAKAMDEYNDEAFKNYNEKALVPCELCGRTFLPDRLVVHARS